MIYHAFAADCPHPGLNDGLKGRIGVVDALHVDNGGGARREHLSNAQRG